MIRQLRYAQGRINVHSSLSSLAASLLPRCRTAVFSRNANSEDCAGRSVCGHDYAYTADILADAVVEKVLNKKN